MFAYVCLGTDDLSRAVAFYDPLMAILGQSAGPRDAEEANWGRDAGGHPYGFGIGRLFDRRPASAGNGTMIAFHARDPAMVRALHAAALSGGGQDEGPPGPRPQYGADFYAAYARDPDGNKLAFVCYLAV